MRRFAWISVWALVLVDAPLVLAALIVGWRYGYVDTFQTAFEWRRDHPATYGLTIVTLLVVALHHARRRRAAS